MNKFEGSNAYTGRYITTDVKQRLSLNVHTVITAVDTAAILGVIEILSQYCSTGRNFAISVSTDSTQIVNDFDLCPKCANQQRLSADIKQRMSRIISNSRDICRY